MEEGVSVGSGAVHGKVSGCRGAAVWILNVQQTLRPTEAPQIPTDLLKINRTAFPQTRLASLRIKHTGKKKAKIIKPDQLVFLFVVIFIYMFASSIKAPLCVS